MTAVLITGVTGQDGSFLAEQFIGVGTYCIWFGSSKFCSNYWRIQSILHEPRFQLVEGDITDPKFVTSNHSREIKPLASI